MGLISSYISLTGKSSTVTDMKSLTLFVSAMTLLASLANGAPLEKRAQFCGQYSTQTEGQYIV
jgi:hypothetical protein